VKRNYLGFQRLKAAPLFLFCFSVFFYFSPSAPPLLRAQEWREAAGATIGMRLPEMSALDPRVFPYEKTAFRGLSLRGEVSPFLDWRPSSLRRRAEIDSTGKYFMVSEELNGLALRPRYVVTIQDNLHSRWAYDRALVWHQIAAENVYRTLDEQRRGPGGLNIEIPVPIKSKAFEQIFGGNTVGLNVQGDISIKAAGRGENRSEVKTAFTRGSDFSFKMNQTQRFTVTGRIGEKVTVNVDQDSERAFDFENNIKLNYTGFDDDVVQKIEAGNVSLQLPGTRFVTAGGNSAGLFGIKTEMQFGNLALTAVASQEKGENKRLSLSGGATEGSQKIQDYDYRRFTYFFIDSLYRDQYRRYNKQWIHTYNQDRVIADIKIYKSAPGYDQRPEQIPGVAFPADTLKFREEIYRGNFILLYPNTDYYIQNDLGYIQMTNPLGDEEVLAVAYKTTAGNTVYDADYDPQKRSEIRLLLVKAKSPTPAVSTWNLEWKNVYYLGSRNIPEDGFELKVFFKPPSGDPQEALSLPGGTKSYLEIFGLDVRDNTGQFKPDNVVDKDVVILNLARGELIFPDLKPFDPEGVFDRGTPLQNLLPADKRTTVMYNTKERAKIDADSKFYIDVRSKTRSSNYSLGFNVIDGSEKVLLNGVELQRDTDYIIDYFSGNLVITKEEASKPSANVEISYQSNSLFQLEKKSIIGTRAEYRLSQNSYIGGTLMYLNQRTLDQRIRLTSSDNGPMRNLIWDVNAALRFQPNFLSRALNALPMLSTQEPSDLRIEGEIAQILPNPNTLNSKVPGDKDGVAYVDDFESSKRTTPLGVNRRGWVQSSIPQEILKDATNPAPPDAFGFKSERSALARRGNLIWFNPYTGVLTSVIYPNRDVNSTNQVTQVLTMVFNPADSANIPKTRSWGGIMRALSPGFYDQTESKFLEIWLQGTKGRLHVDLGQISEDVIPNGSRKRDPDTEDIFNGIRNNILDDGEDVGLDGLAGADPGDFWDINNNGRRDWGEPLSNDDWSYKSGSDDYRFINGTENSKNDANEAGGAIRPDTEDINANGGLDQADNYFSYAFDLSRTHPDYKKFRAGGDSTGSRLGWVLYRIPLQDSTLILSKHRRDAGKPDLTRIEYVRLWWEGVDTVAAALSIAEISLAGNEWKELGTGRSETYLRGYKPTPRFEVTVVNTDENLEYTAPPGVQQERDRITLLFAKEQSQILRVKSLRKDEIAVAQKTFFQPVNLVNYNRLKMFVHGQDSSRIPTHIKSDTSDVEFFIRFGADTSNFYEFREKVFGQREKPWDKKNEMDISLLDLTDFKNKPALTDTIAGVVKPPYFFQRLKEKNPGSRQELRIRGNPSLTNVRILWAGIKNRSDKPFSGEIWMDELRVSEVKKDKGIALRARADLKLADFMTISGEVNRQDADFHNVSQRFGGGDNRTSYTLSSSINADKLLPQGLGLSLPISVNYAKSAATPKYKPGTDIQITDSFTEEDLRKIRSINDQLGFNVSVRRRSRSQNFFIKNTLDNLSGSLSYNKTNAENSQTKYSRRTAWTGDVSYNLNFGQKNYIEPFKFFGKAPLLRKLTNTKLYYTPQNVSAQVQANTNQDKQETRLAGSEDGVRSATTAYTAVSSLRSSMKLLENLSGDFSQGYTSDLRKAGKRGILGLLSGDYENLNVNQGVSVKYAPNLFPWFNPNIGYSSTYRYTNNIQQQDVGRGAGTSTNLTASTTLRFSELFQIFKRKAPAPGREEESGRKRQPPPRTPPGQQQNPEENRDDRDEQDLEKLRERLNEEERQQPRTPPGQEQPEKDKQEKKKEDKPKRRSISPLQLLAFFTKFKDVNVNFSRTDNYSDFALRRGRPQWRYQLGLTRNPGIAKVQGVTTTPSNYSRRDNLSISSGIDLSRSFNLTARFDHDESRNESTTITGTSSDSWLRTSELGLKILPDVEIPFPEWTVSWSGLEKFKLFGKFASNLSLSHGFGGKKSSVWNGSPDRVTNEDFSFNFRPLIKVNMTLKNGMITSFQYSKSTGERPTYNTNGSLQSASLSRNKEISFTITYSKQSGFKLPLPFLKNKELRNSIDLSVNFLFNENETGGRLIEGEKKGENTTTRWSLSPRLTYSFSNRVRGGAHFEVGKTKSPLTGTANIKELGIDVNISIRGE